MSKEAQRRLFDPFFATKEMGEGSGLGLYFCHNEIARSGGSIYFDSEEGVGSRFEITPPHAMQSADEPKVAKGQRPQLGKTLIIDDEVLVARALKRMLQSDKVQIASSGTEALGLLERDEFEYVFCDLMMPEMSGPEFYSKALRIRPELEDRIVFITGGAFTESSTSFVNEHQGRMLYKPFTRQALADMLEQVRERSDAAGQSQA